MAGLNSLRTRMGWLLALFVGFALLAFLLGDLTSNGTSLNKKMYVGEINGEKVSYQQFQNQLDHVKMINEIASGGENSDSQMQDAERNQAWNQLISDYAFNPGFTEAGLTVSENEQIDMVQGQYVSPYMQQYFVNPQTGDYDKSLVKNFVSNLDQNSRLRYFWNDLNNRMIEERVMNKFVTLMRKSVFITDLEIAQGVAASNNNYTANYVKLPYTSVSDSSVQVSDADLRKFYDEHKSMFKQEESREIEYVVYNVLPSEQDYADAEKYITDLANEFSVAENPLQYASNNTQGKIVSTYYREDELTPELATFAFGGSAQTMFGPKLDGDTYTLARVAARKSMPDSVTLARILLPETDAKRADSIVTELRKGSNFAELAGKFSGAPDAQKGGELGAVTYNQLPSELGDKVFAAKVGELVQLNYGGAIHIFKILNRSKEYPKVQLAVVSYPIEPSSHTQQIAYSEASKFIAAAQGSNENFNKAVSDNALSKRVAIIRSSDTDIKGLENSREIVRWAFTDASKTPISQIMEIDGDYVIASLVAQREKGTASFEQVKNDILPVVRREKIGKMLAEKLASATSLEQAAQANNTTIGEIVDLNYNAFYIPEVGVDPALIGAICAAGQQGKLSKPVIANSGVFLFDVTAKSAVQEVTPESEKVRLQANADSYAAERALQALYNLCDIKDMRVKYF